MNEQEIGRLLSVTTAELWTQLGNELSGEPILPPSPRELTRLARAWFSRNRNALVERICGNSRVKTIMREANDPTKRSVALVVAIADVVTAAVTGVSPWTLSALLVQEGLEQLCREAWTSPDAE